MQIISQYSPLPPFFFKVSFLSLCIAEVEASVRGGQVFTTELYFPHNLKNKAEQDRKWSEKNSVLFIPKATPEWSQDLGRKCTCGPRKEGAG